MRWYWKILNLTCLPKFKQMTMHQICCGLRHLGLVKNFSASHYINITPVYLHYFHVQLMFWSFIAYKVTKLCLVFASFRYQFSSYVLMISSDFYFIKLTIACVQVNVYLLYMFANNKKTFAFCVCLHC